MLALANAVVFAYMPSQTLLSEEELRTAGQERDMTAAEKRLQSIFPGLRKQFDLQRKWLLDPAHANAEYVHNNFLLLRSNALPLARMIPLPGWFPTPGLAPEAGKRYNSMVSALMHPFSRGSVHIASTDPQASPAIDPGMSHRCFLEIRVLCNNSFLPSLLQQCSRSSVTQSVTQIHA
jgi:hypothetical protein